MPAAKRLPFASRTPSALTSWPRSTRTEEADRRTSAGRGSANFVSARIVGGINAGGIGVRKIDDDPNGHRRKHHPQGRHDPSPSITVFAYIPQIRTLSNPPP